MLFSKALQLKSDSKRRLFAQPLTCFVPSKLKASLNQELVAWCKKPSKAFLEKEWTRGVEKSSGLTSIEVVKASANYNWKCGPDLLTPALPTVHVQTDGKRCSASWSNVMSRPFAIFRVGQAAFSFNSRLRTRRTSRDPLIASRKAPARVTSEPIRFVPSNWLAFGIGSSFSENHVQKPTPLKGNLNSDRVELT